MVFGLGLVKNFFLLFYIFQREKKYCCGTVHSKRPIRWEKIQIYFLCSLVFVASTTKNDGNDDYELGCGMTLTHIFIYLANSFRFFFSFSTLSFIVEEIFCCSPAGRFSLIFLSNFLLVLKNRPENAVTSIKQHSKHMFENIEFKSQNKQNINPKNEYSLHASYG